MDQLGRFALLLAMVLAAYGMVAAAIGARRRRPALVDSARRTTFALFAAVATANGAMLVALLHNDFAIRYVAENSSLETPTFFKVLSLWAADDGSLLLWNLVLAGYLVAVALRFRRYRPVTFPYALAVLNAVQIFYLILVNGPSRPFGTLANPPADGRGPAALLQNHPLMAVHPPFLYLGFIGFTVPFAFGIAALLVGGGSDHWAALTRRWTLVVWCFLSIGLLLGGLWSYSVLGWGGYWAWDPVENVALLPWLVSTAFLHSVMLQERRGIARLWNVVLVIGAFALTTFGTFLTRGNVLSSVHTFSQTGVGPAYLAFLALVLVVGFGLVAWRLPTLRTPARIDSAISREAAFVGNNVLLLVVTGIILLGTVFPLVVEAVANRQVTVGGPYFRESLAPVFLLLLLLVASAPLLPWRAANRTRALRRLRLPGAVAGVIVIALAFAGIRDVYAIAGFALAGAVAVGNGTEIISGLAAARRGVDRGWWTALRNGRRRYAGLAVHVGLAVLVVGITASSNFAKQTEVTLKQGQSTTFAGYTLRYQGLRSQQQPQRQVLTTRVAVTDSSGTRLDPLHPSLNLYPSESEPIGTPSIRHGVVNDLYSSVIGLENNGKSATFRFFVNPGVTWLWVGGAIMVLSGIAAALPARRRRGRRSDPEDGQTPADRRELVETGAN
ncbi:MAG TPA: cytochrome c-type biogenesis CcmF C-terminal domain-containing protein [Mycobacteriales bacterium]|nr:cytochrome c-type biogenesis CcmF C-terminal domain-containing protein [Mycobacteriales bacterium]